MCNFDKVTNYQVIKNKQHIIMKQLLNYLIYSLVLFSCSKQSTEKKQNKSHQDSITTKKSKETNNSKELKLFDCSHRPENSFEPLLSEIEIIQAKSLVSEEYKKQISLVACYFDSLKLVEESRNEELAKALGILKNSPNINLEKLNRLEGKICLIKSNRPSAEKLCASERLELYDDLRSTTFKNLDSLIREVVINNNNGEIANAERLPTEDLIIIMENDELLSHFDGYISWEKYEVEYGIDYKNAVESYNDFVKKNLTKLKTEGYSTIRTFPTFSD